MYYNLAGVQKFWPVLISYAGYEQVAKKNLLGTRKLWGFFKKLFLENGSQCI